MSSQQVLMSPALAQHTCGLAVDYTVLSASLLPLLLRNGSSTGPQMHEERRGKLCYAELRQKHHPALLELSIPAEMLSTPSDRDMSARPPSDAGCLSFIGAGAGSLSVKRIVRSVAAEGDDGPLLSAGVTLLIFAFRITVPPILYVGRVRP
jgi:hypothetical protein